MQSIYPSRDALIAFEEALELGEKFYSYLEHSQREECLSIVDLVADKFGRASAAERATEPSPNRLFTVRFSAGWAYSYILTVAVSYLESQKQYDQAILYLRCLIDSPFNGGKRGDWYERLCLDLEHLGKKDDSLMVCEEALAQQIRPTNRVGLEKR